MRSVACLLAVCAPAAAFVGRTGPLRSFKNAAEVRMSAAVEATPMVDSVESVKAKILQLSASTDRGQLSNEGVSKAYLSAKDRVRSLVERLTQLKPTDAPLTSSDLSGEWELVYSTCQLFRSSPFFQMVEAAYANPEKSNLFFKLHELQTRSWGISSVGRVSQVLDMEEPAALEEPEPSEEAAAPKPGPSEGAEDEGYRTGEMAMLEPIKGNMESEVDLILLPLTSIPLVGFFKLFPTFGGCVITTAKTKLTGDNNSVLELRVEETKLDAVENVDLLPVAGDFFKGKSFPTGDLVERLMGGVPVVSLDVKYVDSNFRVMQDAGGELFVYARPLGEVA